MELSKLINENYNMLNESDFHIIKYISNNIHNGLDLTINELAVKCNVSKSTILRFTKKLGLSGYSEFKVLLNPRFIKQKDSKEYLDDLGQSVSQVIEQNSEHVIKRVCDIIANSNRIFLYGTGSAQKNFAAHLKQIFISLGKNLILIDAELECYTMLKDFHQNDGIIIISLSGETQGLDKLTQVLKITGIKVVSITSLETNELASKADYNLYGSSLKKALNNGGLHQSTVFYYIIAEVIVKYYIDMYIN